MGPQQHIKSSDSVPHQSEAPRRSTAVPAGCCTPAGRCCRRWGHRRPSPSPASPTYLRRRDTYKTDTVKVTVRGRGGVGHLLPALNSEHAAFPRCSQTAFSSEERGRSPRCCFSKFHHCQGERERGGETLSLSSDFHILSTALLLLLLQRP